jgi:hypothetical protein
VCKERNDPWQENQNHDSLLLKLSSHLSYDNSTSQQDNLSHVTSYETSRIQRDARNKKEGIGRNKKEQEGTGRKRKEKEGGDSLLQPVSLVDSWRGLGVTRIDSNVDEETKERVQRKERKKVNEKHLPSGAEHEKQHQIPADGLRRMARHRR